MLFWQRSGRLDRCGQAQSPQTRHVVTTLEHTTPESEDPHGNLRVSEGLTGKEQQAANIVARASVIEPKRKNERRAIERIFDDVSEWGENTMTIDEKAYISSPFQVVAVPTGMERPEGSALGKATGERIGAPLRRRPWNAPTSPLIAPCHCSPMPIPPVLELGSETDHLAARNAGNRGMVLRSLDNAVPAGSE